jgi:hypothetical protein
MLRVGTELVAHVATIQDISLSLQAQCELLTPKQEPRYAQASDRRLELD